MGEPVDKNLWGELEPEEGVHYFIVYTPPTDGRPQKKKKSPRKNRTTKRRKKLNPHPLMACKRLQAWKRHLE
jgi:hypothetical protein